MFGKYSKTLANHWASCSSLSIISTTSSTTPPVGAWCRRRAGWQSIPSPWFECSISLLGRHNLVDPWQLNETKASEAGSEWGCGRGGIGQEMKKWWKYRTLWSGKVRDGSGNCGIIALLHDGIGRRRDGKLLKIGDPGRKIFVTATVKRGS